MAAAEVMHEVAEVVAATAEVLQMPAAGAVEGQTSGEVAETKAQEPKAAPVAQTTGKNVTRLRDLRLSARDQFMLDPKIIIVEDGHNPRDYNIPENRAHLDDLKTSIRENGTISPLWVRYDAERKAAVLVDGECRLRANLELIAEGVEIEAVPCIQVPGGNEPDRLLLAVVANQNKPLSELELGGAFRKLFNFGWSPEKIAKKSGKAVAFIARSMELADAPQAVQEMVKQQEVSPSLAISEVRKNGAAAVETLKAKATAAKAKGQKTATRERTQAPPVINLVPMVRKLLRTVERKDLESTEFEWVDVKREVLLAIAKQINF